MTFSSLSSFVPVSRRPQTDDLSFRSLAAISLAGTLLFAGATLSASAQTVDQMQVEANQSRAVLPGSALGQTYTPELAGFVAGIEVSASIHPAGQPLNVEIWAEGRRAGYLQIDPADAGGTPQTLDPGAITGSYFDFSPFAVPSVPGEQLELRTWTTEAVFLTSLRVSTANVYPGGTITFDGVASGGDIAFKAFVNATAPPAAYDQIQPDGVDQARALLPASVTGQTMTVGRSGQVTGIELSLDAPPSADDDLTVEVFRHGAGDPVSQGQVVVTRQQIIAAEDPRFLYHAEILGTFVDLSPLAIDVTAGEVLEIRMSTANSVGLYSVRNATSNAYAAGNMTIDGAPSGGDLAFKLFVVQPEVFSDAFESGDFSAWSSASP